MSDPPRDEVELMARADAIAGHTLGGLARMLGRDAPVDLRGHKGWAGDLVERALGVRGGSASAPDVRHLGVEIKSVPLHADGRPRESTWVTAAPRGGPPGPWASSPVRHKLARVLWVPILDEGPPAARRLGVSLLWSPSAEQEAVLARDWAQLSELLALGEVWRWSARAGEALQLRPKAARGDAYIWVVDDGGDWVQATPQGFYLRTSFTAQVLTEEPRRHLPPARAPAC